MLVSNLCLLAHRQRIRNVNNILNLASVKLRLRNGVDVRILE